MVEAFPSKLVGVSQESEGVHLQQPQRGNNDHLGHLKLYVALSVKNEND